MGSLLRTELTSDRADFKATSAQIYPAESGLVLGEPEHDGHSVDYLDMTVWRDSESQQWHSKLYDKKIAMVAKGLKLNMFPPWLKAVNQVQIWCRH